MVDVAPGGDLDLQAPVAGLDPCGHGGGEDVGAGGESEGGAGGHLPPRPLADEPGRQRGPRGPTLGVEQGQLQRRGGHRVADDVADHPPEVVRLHPPGGEEAGCQVVPEHEPRPGRELRRVGGLGEGGALPPALALGPEQPDEHDVAPVEGAVGGGEGPHHGEGHVVQLHRIDQHADRA